MSVLMMFLSWLSFRKWNSSLGSLHVKSAVNLKVISFLTSSMLRISLNSTVILTFVRPSSSINLGNLFMNNGEGGWKYSELFIQHYSCQAGPLYCIHWWDTGQSCSCPRLTGPRSPWSCHSGSQRAHTARSEGDKVDFSHQICIRCLYRV